MNDSCPCQSGNSYANCCQPFLGGQWQAQTAEQLMRSRFSAFVFRNAAYLLQTWHPSTRPRELSFSEEDVEWQQLQVIQRHQGQATDQAGKVEFVARGEQLGQAVELHERSRFVREEGRWFYLDGEILPAKKSVEKTGRNAPCPCGSGKKFKRCCG